MAGGAQGLEAPERPLNSRQRRQMLEAAVERLLGAVDGILADLDALDGDADLEPSLAGLNLTGLYGDQRDYARGARDEREDEHDGREPDVDDEYSLGWAESDCQRDRPPSYPSDDGEPSLGASAALDQSQWGEADPHLIDREDQCEGEGEGEEREPEDWFAPDDDAVAVAFLGTALPAVQP